MSDATETGKKIGIQTYPNAHVGGEYKPEKEHKEYRHKKASEKKLLGQITHVRKAKGGRIKAAHGWGRTNLLDESRRIRSEPQTRNVRAEEARVGGELSAGFKKGGKS